MIKKILIIAAVFVGVALIGLIALGYYFQPSKDTLLQFIKDNPDRTAIKLVRDSTVLVEQNADRQMPLASTVKIILAIEYAEQAAAGDLLPDELIPLEELNKFYVPNTDGGAHPQWLKSVEDKIKNDKIPIREISKGMIRYSSNANTEWLCHRLGLRNINARIRSLDIKNHSEMYYIVAALFVGKEEFPELKGWELVAKLRELSDRDYISSCEKIHEKLTQDTTYKSEIGNLTMEVQRVWSDRLPASTVAEYVGLMQKINSRNYFEPAVQVHLNDVMEFLLENEKNREWLKHAGMKGGSTAFVLTKALYATDKKGHTTELAYFINGMTIWESVRLQPSMNAFELAILQDEEFRKKVVGALK
ncbi:MAG: serine hydrolase [Bacteroidota bacterium]